MTEPHEKIYKSKKTIFIDNFIGGIGWAIGASLGLTLIIAILSFILSKVNLIPFLGTFIASIIHEVLKNKV